MDYSIDRKKLLKNALGFQDLYCTGYPYRGSYLSAIIMNVNTFKAHDSKRGSYILNSIMAFDNAEISGVYLGQINMQMVSSFCGPEGLIWGYDLANNEPQGMVKNDIYSFANKPGITVEDGSFLHEAASDLFGTKEKKIFPILPGSHVPCAARFDFKKGPSNLYSMVAVAIPKNRAVDACLFMEDIGSTCDMIDSNKKEELIGRFVNSIAWIGRSHNIEYEKILLYYSDKHIPSGEIGCALIAIPYFHLAKMAFTPNLVDQRLSEWRNEIVNRKR